MKYSDMLATQNVYSEDILAEDIRSSLHRIFDEGMQYSEVEMDSEWADIHLDISRKPEPAHPHSHSFWEIILCIRGKIPYIIGKEQYQVQAGDVIVVPPEISHSLLPWKTEDGVYERKVLWCSHRLADWVSRQIPDNLLFNGQGCVLRLTQPQQNYLRYLLRLGVRESNMKKTGYEVIQTGIALQLVSYLSRFTADQQAMPQSDHSSLLMNVIGYVQENLAGDLTVSATARHFSISDSTLSHLFKQEIGIGFYRYVMRQRLTESKHLIYQNLPMEMVAQSVGFGNYSAFYRAFKKEFAISPAQYRQLLPK